MHKLCFVLLIAAACNTTSTDVTSAAITAPPWSMTILQPAAAVPGGAFRSAEGPALCTVGGALWIAAGWEVSGEITLTSTVPPIQTIVVDHHQGVEGVHCADVDGDGTDDVISASLRNYRHVRVSWGPDYSPSGATQIAAANAIGSWKWVTAGDVDGDGQNDVIVSGRNEPGDLNAGRLMWFGSSTPHDGSSWIGHQVAFIGDTYALEARDLNFDGRLDIFLSDRTGAHNQGTFNGVWWYEGDGLGGFTAHLMFDPPIGTPFGAALGDYDDDGVLEMVAAWRSSSTGEWFQTFEQTSPGVWIPGLNYMPPDAGLGEAHGVNTCEIDGRTVVAASFVRGDPGQSWVLWLDPITGEAHDVSGPATDMDGDMTTGCYRKTDQLRCAGGVIFATEGGDNCLLDDYGLVRFDR